MRHAVFVVEDDLDDMAIMKQAFVEIGNDFVVGFPNALDLFKHLEKLDEESLPKLIISDYNMPTLDGFNVASFLKRHSRYASILLVVMTTSIPQMDTHRLLNAGVTKICIKPNSYQDYKQMAKELNTLVSIKDATTPH